MVFLVGRVNDMTVPKGIVGKDKVAWTKDGERHLVSITIGALVAIDKCHIKLNAEFGSLGDSITNDKGNLIGNRRVLYPRAREVFLFVIDLKGLEMSVIIQSFCHTDSRIAAEGTHL